MKIRADKENDTKRIVTLKYWRNNLEWKEPTMEQKELLQTLSEDFFKTINNDNILRKEKEEYDILYKLYTELNGVITDLNRMAPDLLKEKDGKRLCAQYNDVYARLNELKVQKSERLLDGIFKKYPEIGQFNLFPYFGNYADYYQEKLAISSHPDMPIFFNGVMHNELLEADPKLGKKLDKSPNGEVEINLIKYNVLDGNNLFER